MILKFLLQDFRYELKGLTNRLSDEVTEIVFDSQKANSGTVFVAICGTEADGHNYIHKAIENGCNKIVCEKIENHTEGILFVLVPNSQVVLGMMASCFYEHPSRQIRLVGVTGTNGKTTVATLLFKLFSALGQKAGLISTVEYRIGNEILPSTHTTPDAVSLNGLLARMRDEGCDYAFMEVSSHACDQERIRGLVFEGAIFTNITHDHLDYHGTFQNYIWAKKKFFDQLTPAAFALVNIDDKRGQVMIQNTSAKTYSYALRTLADFRTKIVENNLDGLVLDFEGKETYTRLVGDFNAYNLLAVYATAVLMGEDKDEVLSVISNLSAAEGRFDSIRSENQSITAIVDYAHTPDALEKVLQTLDKTRSGNENIITVVGCGGNRDKTKRPVMAKTACNYSDQVILTSDNPRNESPDAILEEMEQGIPAQSKLKTLIIADRKQAIRTACRLARKGDIILVAGKGHEKYQEIKGQKFPFDDKEELKSAMAELNL